MALIRLGPIAAAISGSIGGVTYAHTKNGTIARKKLESVRQRTKLHLEQEAFYSILRKAWRTLTPPQRTAWNVIALQFPNVNRLGQATRLSGFALYMRLNSDGNQFRFAGLPIPFFPDPPIMTVAPAMIASNLDMSISGGYHLDETPPAGLPNTINHYYGARTFRDTPTTAPRAYRFIGLGFGPPGTTDFTAKWNSIIGPPQIGEFVFLKARYAALNAVFSPPQIFSTSVGA